MEGTRHLRCAFLVHGFARGASRVRVVQFFRSPHPESPRSLARRSSDCELIAAGEGCARSEERRLATKGTKGTSLIFVGSFLCLLWLIFFSHSWLIYSYPMSRLDTAPAAGITAPYRMTAFIIAPTIFLSAFLLFWF